MEQDLNKIRAAVELLHKRAANAALTAFGERSPDIVLAKEIHLTRLNAKTEPDELLEDEFMRMFCVEPAEAVEFAFRERRERSPFFPAISDIVDLIGIWKRRKREADDEERRRAEQAETEHRRAKGECVDVAEVRQLFVEATAKAVMDGPRQPRSYDLRVDLADQHGRRRVVEHTPAEWADRRNRLREQVPLAAKWIEQARAGSGGESA